VINIEIISNLEGDEGGLIVKAIGPEIVDAFRRIILGDRIYQLYKNGNGNGNGKEIKVEERKEEKRGNGKEEIRERKETKRGKRKKWVQVTPELAHELGCQINTIRYWIHKNKIESMIDYDQDKIGRRVVELYGLRKYVSERQSWFGAGGDDDENNPKRKRI
jgi:hypothetical protein